MTGITPNVLLIENKLESITQNKEIFSSLQLQTTRMGIPTSADLLVTLLSNNYDCIMCHVSQSTVVQKALKKLSRTLPLLLLGPAAKIPKLPSSTNGGIAYLNAPFSPNVLKAVVEILIRSNQYCHQS